MDISPCVRFSTISRMLNLSNMYFLRFPPSINQSTNNFVLIVVVHPLFLVDHRMILYIPTDHSSSFIFLFFPFLIVGLIASFAQAFPLPPPTTPRFLYFIFIILSILLFSSLFSSQILLAQLYFNIMYL